MSNHDLNMPEPQKVLAGIDDSVDSLKKIKGTIETTSQIGNMGLAIGGLDAAFKNLEQLNPSLEDAIKVFNTTKESVEQHVATFKRKNSDVTY
jgi:cephalosporin-C deacetylase-like acetyl esterase